MQPDTKRSSEKSPTLSHNLPVCNLTPSEAPNKSSTVNHALHIWICSLTLIELRKRADTESQCAHVQPDTERSSEKSSRLNHNLPICNMTLIEAQLWLTQNALGVDLHENTTNTDPWGLRTRGAHDAGASALGQHIKLNLCHLRPGPPMCPFRFESIPYWVDSGPTAKGGDDPEGGESPRLESPGAEIRARRPGNRTWWVRRTGGGGLRIRGRKVSKRGMTPEAFWSQVQGEKMAETQHNVLSCMVCCVCFLFFYEATVCSTLYSEREHEIPNGHKQRQPT